MIDPILPLPWDPFSQLGSTAAQIATDAWTAAWLSVWAAGLWVLRLVLGFMDAWMTPDLSENGPGHDLYQATFWLAGVLMVALLAVQLGVAAFRRDGKQLAGALIGVAQFGLVCFAWISYAVILTLGMGGLTRSMMESLLNVTSWNDWKPWEYIDGKQITDAGVATALGLLGLFVWLAAIAHFIVLLARNAALLVLVGTGPIAAAGLANKTTAAWFWKSFRWLHAAAATPLLVVIVMGVGMKFTEGVAAGKAGSMEATVGTALPAAVLICVSVVAPLALFKLLAFIDPGTASGAAMRAGWQATGGLQGLLNGNPSATTADDGSAAESSDSGSSAGEQGAEAATNSRVTGVVQSAASALGPVGAAFSAGIGLVTSIGSGGASLISDVTNQAGIGHNTYQPDYQGGRNDKAARANREANGSNGNETGGSGEDQSGQPPNAGPTSSDPGPTGGSGGGSGAGGGTGSGGGAGSGGASGGGAGSGAVAGEAAEAAVVLL